MKTASGTKTGLSHQPGRDKVLADRRWLAAHLRDPHVRLVEVDVSPAAHTDWHIDGAVLWNVYRDLKDAAYRTASVAELEQLVARSGIDTESTVVCYGYAPALGFWLLKLLGHRDVRILDCSRDTWRAEGLPWTTTQSRPADSGYRGRGESSGIRVDCTGVRDAIGRPGTSLVDVRSAEEFHGERFWPSGGQEPGGQAGHLPSAVHQPLDGLYDDDGSFRTAARLRDVFAPDVLEGDDELITYCTIGGRAATAWFVLTYLLARDRVQVYDGSWAEWGRLPGAPVDRPLSTAASPNSAVHRRHPRIRRT